MERSLSSNKGIITTSSLSTSSRSGSPSSSSSSSTNYPSPPPAAGTSPRSSPDVPSPSSSSSSSPNSPPPEVPPAVISLPSSSRSVLPVAVVVEISSCAGCKFLGQICAENCVLAPCFPPYDLIKFISVHRVFGASNIINVLQELPESQRADAVSSMLYEANARLRDPVYGSAGAICQLQMQVSHLQAELAKAQAEVVNMQCQQANLMSLICTEMDQSPQATSTPQQSLDNIPSIPMSILDDTNSFLSMEYLWT